MSRTVAAGFSWCAWCKRRQVCYSNCIYCDIRWWGGELVRNDDSCFSLACANVIRGLNGRLVTTNRCTLRHTESRSVWWLRRYTASVHTTGVFLQTLGSCIVVLLVETPQTLGRCARARPNSGVHVISKSNNKFVMRKLDMRHVEKRDWLN